MAKEIPLVADEGIIREALSKTRTEEALRVTVLICPAPNVYEKNRFNRGRR
jgi:hypothetical protein